MRRFLRRLFARENPNEVQSWYTLLKGLKSRGVLLALAVLMAGCGPDAPPPGGELYSTGLSGMGSLVVVRLQDGTRCAIYKGYKRGGLDCDWKQP